MVHSRSTFLASLFKSETSRFVGFIFYALGLFWGLTGCASEELISPSSSLASAESTQSTLNKTDQSTHFSLLDQFDAQECSFDPQDPYDPKSRFLQGPWEGECHDTHKQRPAHFLGQEEAQLYQDTQGWLALANVYHRGGFWVAFIPENALENVFFQLEYFPAVVPAGHTQLRLQYNESILLYGQSTHLLGQVDTTKDLSLSIEAVTQVGDQYDLFKGAQEHFSIVYRVTTMEARYQSMITEQDHHVEQWILDMEEEEKEALLPSYVQTGLDFSLKVSYHTLFRNCTTEIIEELDRVVRYTWGEQAKKFIVKITEIYPNIVRTALIARGLLPLGKGNDWFPLEEDEAFIQEMKAQSAY